MKTKSIAPILMLFAGAVTSITMYIMQFELKTLLAVLLVVLLVFYIAGIAIAKTIESFQRANEKEAQLAEEGEVIEKEVSESEEEEETEPVLQGEKETGEERGLEEDSEET